MLPLTVSSKSGYQPIPNINIKRNNITIRSYVVDYLKKIIDYNQMDFQIVFSQMVQLCRSPYDVYKTTQYRKQIKNQWARDDPAFIVVILGLLLASALSYCIAFGVTSIGCGLIIALIGRYIGNSYLKINQSRAFTVEQDIEYLYCFDVHVNAFFPLFLIVHVLQFFLLPLLLSSEFYSLLLANTLYYLAFVVYYYICYLGYSALPFLQKQQYLLLPIVFGGVIYLISIILHLNASVIVLSTYF